ncbi:Oligopeptide transport system permease protein OppB (TC 3.A.1.5.1) [Olavius sp. associated proteobacterium Delta 1]|nr:Oligopeptide transport system permease protein OppB (TC 3.A.1.5.1) [Olavius sp. associated proteobacterium Delta 1]
MSAKILEVRNLEVTIDTPSGVLTAIDSASFDLDEGEILGLVGESGSGKTLTGRAIMRLLPSKRMAIRRGTVCVNGEDIMQFDESRMRGIRGRTIGMIFQNPSSHLDPVMTIGKQIAESIRFHEGRSSKESLARAVELLRQVDMPDPNIRLNSFSHEFSGGMRQRAMIAMALACRPKILIADEPTTALDVTVQAQILRLLLDLRRRRGLSIILVTHDLGIIAQTCDTIAVMYAGRLMERASKQDLLLGPLHPYTKGLIASQPGMAKPREQLPSISGQPPSLASFPAGCRFHPRCDYSEAACRTAIPVLEQVNQSHQTACRRWHDLVRQKILGAA